MEISWEIFISLDITAVSFKLVNALSLTELGTQRCDTNPVFTLYRIFNHGSGSINFKLILMSLMDKLLRG